MDSLTDLASAATLGGLAALQAALTRAFGSHANTSFGTTQAVIDAGSRVHTTGPGGVGILVGKRRRGGRVTHF